MVETEHLVQQDDFLKKLEKEGEALGDTLNVFKGLELFNFMRGKDSILINKL